MKEILWFIGAFYFVNFLLCIPVAIVFKKVRIYGEFPEINKKYPSFERLDLKRWNTCTLFLVGTLNAGPARFMVAWSAALSCSVGMTILMCGTKRGQNEPIGKCRYAMVKILTKVCSRIHQFACGVYWIRSNPKKHFCYKKYLGPDWTPRWDGAGIQITNHQSWVDIMVLLCIHTPSFVAKAQVANYPFIGHVAAGIQSQFIKRQDTVEGHAQAAKDILDRQVFSESGAMPILNIFPEGCTTNGSSIIRFKRGAFQNLRPVRICAMRYITPDCSITQSQDVVGFFKHSAASIQIPYTIPVVDFLPVFEPNEYFWKHHWDGKEDKWLTFANACRAILAEHLGLKLSDAKMEHKFEFKEALKAARAQKKKDKQP